MLKRAEIYRNHGYVGGSFGLTLSVSTLDNAGKIRAIDKHHMLELCLDAAKHYKKAAELAQTITFRHAKPKTILVAGMGGSAIGGALLMDWGEDKLKIPIRVCRNYELPRYANKETLVLVISYSGETEETLSMMLSALEKKCTLFCIGSGGSLLKVAEELRLPYLHVPPGIPPRAALPYLFLPLLFMLEKTGLISNVNEEVFETIKALREVIRINEPRIPLKDNFCKILASQIVGTVPVVYSSEINRSVALRFKQQFNENSKVPARWDVFPELNHNEIEGWGERKKILKYRSFILIRDRNERQETKLRIEATKALLSERTDKVHEVWSVGNTKLARLLSTVIIGDLTSVYLAILRNVDPTPVNAIVTLKNRMRKNDSHQRIIAELKRQLGNHA
ncbi:MAG: bifunctional phosphoglucose/phosphomannose isomerase [Candidatus Bathyarchaeota archaeon]